MSEDSPPPLPPKPKKLPEREEIEEKRKIEDYPPVPPKPEPSEKNEEPIIPKPIPLSEQIIEEVSVPESVVIPTYPTIPQAPIREPISQATTPAEGGSFKWSYFWWGSIFFVVWNIVLMFLLEFALHPRDSSVAGVLAYALGLMGLVIFVFLVRNINKIAWSLPLLILIVFGVSIGLHALNAPIYNPLAPLGERANFAIDTIKNSTNLFTIDGPLFGNVTIETLEQWSLSVFVIDFIFALLMCFVGCLSLAWVFDLFTSEKKPSTPFLIVLGLVFFIIGLVISPIIHLSLAGAVDFGGHTLIGSNYLVGGYDILGDFENATQENINAAIANFLLAAENIRNARSSFQMFSFLYGMFKVTEVLTHVLDASLLLLSGVEPVINGTFQIYQGFLDVAEALNQSFSTPLPTSPLKQQVVNDTLFDKAINRVEEGLQYLGSSTESLSAAVEEITNANLTQITELIAKLPFETEPIQEYIVVIEDYINLFTDVPEIIEILVNKPTHSTITSRFATLTHFLYGAYNIIKATEEIGTNSDYSGTSIFFTNAISNFTLVYNQLEQTIVQQMIDSDTIFFNATLSFLYDMTVLSADISSYGNDLGVVFQGLNDTVLYFDEGYENITDYPTIIADVSSLVTISDSLRNTSIEIENARLDMNLKTSNGTYGVFKKPSQEIVDSLESFNLVENAENAYNIAESFFHLFTAMSNLKDSTNYIKIGAQQFNDTLYVAANNSFISANLTLYNAIVEMDLAISFMSQTAGGNMDQLQDTRMALITIRTTLLNVIVYYTNLINLAGIGPAANPLDVSGNSTVIIIALSSVNGNLSDVKAQ